MRRLFLVGALGVALLLCGPAVDTAWAGKSGFSGGGRSFSSPSGRSYSSGGFSSGSRGGSSFSSPSGKSYSSGGFSSGGRGGSSFSSPSTGGRSYSSGSSGSSPRPAAPSPSVGRSSPAPSAGPFSNPGRPPVSIPSPSGKSYSSGGWSNPSRPPGGYTSPSGKSYLPGGSGPVPAARTSPRGGGFDSAAAEAQRREESRATFTKGKAPEPTYTDPKGTTRPIDPTDRRVEELRRQLDQAQWANRQLRARQFYADYYSRPVVVYHDPYSSYFWWWLLAQSEETRARWVYDHQQVMDDARYRDLLARDAQLEDRVRQLQAQGVPRDPAAAPPGMQPDLMYSDSYVNSVYNPQPPPGWQPAPAPAPVSLPHYSPAASFRHGLRVLLYALLVIGVLAFLIWLVFVKRWGGTPA